MAGTGIRLSFKVDFNEAELRQELGAAMRETEPAITAASQAVGEAAKEVLFSHLKSDVYAKWKPKSYQRRYEDGLMSENAITISASSGLMELRYKPDGSSEQWRHPASGDALIGRIEGGKGYEWRRHPGARPFWKAFTDEMIDSQMASVFDSTMSAQLGEIYEGGTVVERESGDGEY